MTSASSIRILDAQVANQIAAGEVVERPASVIKELVENALDAGATRIEVEADHGVRFLRVVDNGQGIAPEEVPLAFQRFATSKLTDYEDVWQLSTMGFRGEALPSIASVSKVEMCSRTAAQELGRKVILHGGDVQSESDAGAPVGTAITIQDLFYNTPARLKFMNQENTEYKHISQLMEAFALSHPEVAFTWKKKEKTQLSTRGDSDMMGVVRQVFGKTFAASVFHVNHELRGAKLEGVLSYPDAVRKNRNYQYFFVNQRWVKVPALSKILDDLYADLIPKRHYPVAILKLHLPPESVDINVHPSKREVKFKNFSLIYQLLKEALQDALSRYHVDREHLGLDGELESSASAPASAGFTSPTVPTAPTAPAVPSNPQADDLPPWLRTAPPSAAGTAETPSSSVISSADSEAAVDLPPWLKSSSPVQQSGQQNTQPDRQPNAMARVDEAGADYQVGAATSPFVEPPTPEVLRLPEIPEPTDHQRLAVQEARILEQIKPLAQVCENTYIVGRFGRDLVLIDQHVAEERHLYEELIESESILQQPLLISVVFNVDDEERDLLAAYQEQFERAGFVYEDYGPDSMALRAIPHCLKISEAEETFQDILEDLKTTGVVDTHLKGFKLMCKTVACHSAVRAGDALEVAQMQRIVENWSRTRNPYTCPHGRPILLKLSKDEINRRFLRTWS